MDGAFAVDFTLGVSIMSLPTTPVAIRTHKLPPLLLREIGRLITIFSCIEHEMNLLTFSLLRLSTSEGRLAVARQNVRSRFNLIAQLMKVNCISVTHDLKALGREIEELEELRDWIAHGVWSKDGNIFRIQITSGAWQPKGSHLKIERKIIPSGAPFDAQSLHNISDVSVDLLAVVEDVHKQIVAQLQPLPGTRPVLRRARTKPHQHQVRIED